MGQILISFWLYWTDTIVGIIVIDGWIEASCHCLIALRQWRRNCKIQVLHSSIDWHWKGNQDTWLTLFSHKVFIKWMCWMNDLGEKSKQVRYTKRKFRLKCTKFLQLRAFNNQTAGLQQKRLMAARGSSKSLLCLSSTKVINDQWWLHVVIESWTLNCSKFRLYVNGVCVFWRYLFFADETA